MIMIHLLLNLFVIGRSSVAGKKEEGDRSNTRTSQRARHGLKYPERLFFGGSKLANIEEVPYVVAFVGKYGNGTYQDPFCTGAIISEQWVLSAAHCVDGVVKMPFEIIAGCDSVDEVRAQQNKSSRQVRSPIELRIHPYFRTYADHNETRLGGYDIVLIRVASFLFGPGVNRIGLSAEEWKGVKVRNPKYRGEDFIEAECTAFGWGRMKPGVPTKFLRMAKFTAQHGNGGCSICVDDDRTRRMICTTTLSGHSVCPGDSGGPLVCYGLLAGVAHSMCFCATRNGETHLEQLVCGRDNIFSTWMYVCPMLHWIHEVVPDTPDLPVSCRSHPISLTGIVIWMFIVAFYKYSITVRTNI